MEDNSVHEDEGFRAWWWRTSCNSSGWLVLWFFVGIALISSVLYLLGAPQLVQFIAGGVYGWNWSGRIRPFFFPRED